LRREDAEGSQHARVSHFEILRRPFAPLKAALDDGVFTSHRRLSMYASSGCNSLPSSVCGGMSAPGFTAGALTIQPARLPRLFISVPAALVRRLATSGRVCARA